MSELPIDPKSTARTQHKSRIVQMLASTPAVRSELVADIKGQVDEGGYMSEEKLDLAIYRMLKDILE